MALLRVKNLRVERDATVILGGVDWEMRRGEHWVILGANGCGKTSLLKALTGYLTPTEGDIELLGKIYGESDWRELRLRVGIVTSAILSGVPAAEAALETVISGKFAQLDLWARPTRAERAEARGLMEFVGLKGLEGRLWVQLSQGERQRVLIARALMARPEVLILDEPCSGLDPVAREEFLGFVEGLGRRKGGPAIVFVTHHVEEIVPVFSHVMLLKAGRVSASGEIGRVLNSGNLSEAFGREMKVGRRGAPPMYNVKCIM